MFRIHTHLIIYIYICTHLHAHTHRAVIVVLDDHLTFATSVLAFFLVNVLYFLAFYVLQKVTRNTLPQYCVYVLISHFNFHYSGTLLNRHPSTADTHNITDNFESPDCPSIRFNTYKQLLNSRHPATPYNRQFFGVKMYTNSTIVDLFSKIVHHRWLTLD